MVTTRVTEVRGEVGNPGQPAGGGNPDDSGGDDADLGPSTPGYGGSMWPVRRTTRPSLDTLQHDQRMLVWGGEMDRVPPLYPIIDGFRDRRELINWFQAGVVRTLGHLADHIPPVDLERDLALVEALTQGPNHQDEGSAWLHTRIVEGAVLPACGQAYRHLRDKSSERTATAKYANGNDGDDWKNIDPTAEHHIGMRPAYSRLDAEQAEVLSELWGGFHNRGELGEWLHSLHPATYGTFGASDAHELLRDEYGTEQFLSESRHAELHREQFAIVELLPRFADAARRLRASEQSESKPDNTWRQG